MTADTAAPAAVNGTSAGRTPDVLLAEKAILGALLRGSAAAAEAVLEILPSEECFADTTHQAVYGAIRCLAEAGEAVSAPSVLARLVATERGQWLTGQAGVILANLMEHANPAYEAHAQTVLRATIRRRGLLALQRATQLLAERSDFDFDPDETADDIRVLIDQAFALGTPDAGVAAVSDLYEPLINRLESGTPPGVIQFPYADLRELLGCLRPGQLVTVAARPSHGKSLLAQDLARYVGMTLKAPLILFTMEQNRDEVMERFLAAEAGVLLDDITSASLDAGEWQRVSHVSQRFYESALTIDDTPEMTLSHIRARLRGMARRQPAQLAIVDYLQLMKGLTGENRQREVSAAVAGLKSVAREFRIPVVMLCQLNRGPESRHDKRPYISDARESGAVENESDIAILIHRPDYNEPSSPRAGEADLIVDKNRNGRRGVTVTVGFQGHYARFVDLARI